MPVKEFIFSKVAVVQPATLQKWTPSQVFFKAFANFAGTPTFRNNSERLLLNFY